MIDNNCAYCVEGELVDKFGIKICELPASKVYLFKEQSHKGRCIVASKHHVSENEDDDLYLHMHHNLPYQDEMLHELKKYL